MSMKISELIKDLQDFQKEYGDLPVVMSVDCEGNSFSTLKKGDCVVFSFDDNDPKRKVNGAVIYPFAEGFYYPTDAIKNKE